MMWPFIVLTLMGGMVLPMQAGLNSELAKPFGSSTLASLLSFGVGLLSLCLVSILFIRIPMSLLSAMSAAPWWAWLGGVCGAFFVVAITLSAPKLGAVVLIALVVTGQMLASLLLDHFGLMGFAQTPVNSLKIFGSLLLILGVVCIQQG